MYRELHGQVHFWASLVSFNVAFFPMHFLGLAGMPRRYADYPMQFTDFNQVASIAALVFGLSQVYFVLFVVWPALRHRGEPAAQRPWEGAEGLEWEVPSPAPHHTFETPPRLSADATRLAR
jgi:cytochrome c oxidase subunit 1